MDCTYCNCRCTLYNESMASETNAKDSKMIKLSDGMVIECQYKGETRKARIEPKGLNLTAANPCVKVFDLDKNDFRTFTLANLTEVKIISR